MYGSWNKFTSELLTLLASLPWGSSFVAVKLGLTNFDPLWFVQWRMFVASVILLAVSIFNGPIRTYFRNKSVFYLGTSV